MNGTTNHISNAEALAQRLAGLSPEKRAALEKLLQKENAEAAAASGIPRRNTAAPPPLSFAQQRLWFLDRFEPGLTIYNIPLAIRMQGALCVAALQRSLDEIVQRHEALRTTIATLDEQPVQIIARAAQLPLAEIDLCALPKAEREAEVKRLAMSEAVWHFDLERGPLMRATLLHWGAAEHILLLTLHHIVFDGWSLGVFVRELTTLYTAFVEGKASSLPALPIQYADYAVWQRARLHGEVLHEHIAHWKRVLHGAPASLDLPTDRRRPAFQTFRGGNHTCLIPKSMMEALARFSQREGVTLFMTLLAAFNVLLHRYSGQDDLVVGTPVANRDRPEIENLIGFFINTLVLRLPQLRDNPTFRELLARVRHVALEAYDHQELPFEKLVEALHPERDLSRSPFFQVMFGLQSAPSQTLTLPGLKWQRLKIDYATSLYDVSLFLWKTEQGLIGVLEYNADLFEASTTRRLLEDYQTLLRSILAHPERRLSDLPLLTEAKRRQVLLAWNDTDAEYPRACFHELFEAQAAATPEAVALVCAEQQLTYRELNRRADRLAHHLRSLGIGPEVKVGICVERAVEMLVGLLGILKAGGAYVPLDPMYPAERIEYVLQDARVKVLIVDRESSRAESGSWIEDCGLWIVDRESQRKGDDQRSTTHDLQLTPDNLAYVIYTSGSTGKPKGVAISHAALTNFLCSMQKTPGFSSQDVLLAVTTLSFDIAALELYLPLLAGGRVVLADHETTKDGRALCALLTSSRATVMQATPATWRMLLEAGWRGDTALKVLCGGEALPRELAEQLLPKCGALWNMYGPTETTIWSAAYQLTSEDEDVPFGRPIANTQLYVLDAHMQPVPLGVPGELYIGGHGLARGYLNRPDLTAEKFIPISDFGFRISENENRIDENLDRNPQSEIRNRIYCTGDLAKYLEDGTLEFLGRMDHQVKLRGFRIELGEIENVVVQHPAVRQATVIVREDVSGDQRLVAYLLARASNQQPTTSDEFRSFLREKVPEYMIPSAFVFMNEMPLTPNGKVDRRALPAPEKERHDFASRFVAPSTPTEIELAEIWQQLLRTNHLGVRDNFFNVGGHSLLATRLLARVRTQFGAEIALRDFFKQPTLAELAVLVEDAILLQSPDEKLEAALAELEGVAA